MSSLRYYIFVNIVFWGLFCGVAFGEEVKGGLSGLDESSVRAGYEKAVARYAREDKDYQSRLSRIMMSEYQRRLSSVDNIYGEKIKRLREEEMAYRDNVIVEMEKFLQKYGDQAKESSGVLYRLAILYYERSEDQFLSSSDESVVLPDYSKTLDSLERLRNNFESFEHLDGVYYLEGYCLQQMDRMEESKDKFIYLVEHYPDSPKVPEAYTRIGEYYFMLSQDAIQGLGGNVEWKKALEYYSKAVEKGPNTSVYDRALYRKAWTEYYIEDYDNMIKDFKLLVEYADRVPQGSALRQEAIEFMAVSLAEEDWDLSDNVSRDPNFGMKRFDMYLHDGKGYENEVLRKYADTLLEQSRFDYAAEAYEAYLRRNVCGGDNPKVVRQYISALNMSGQSIKAMQEQANVSKRLGKDSEWYQCQVREGNLEAIAGADTIILLALKESIASHYNRAQEAEVRYRDAMQQLESGTLSGEALQDARNDVRESEKEFRENNQQIAVLVEELLLKFPNDEEAYTFRYILAEAYFNDKQYLKAMSRFKEVRDSGEGRYRRSAANGVIESRLEHGKEEVLAGKGDVLSLDGDFIKSEVKKGKLGLDIVPMYLLKEMVSEGSLEAEVVEKEMEARRGKAVQVRVISESGEDLVASRDKYIEMSLDLEKGEGESDLESVYRYQNALVYYHHGHYDEARRRFDEIIEKDRSSDYAVVSAQLVLSIYEEAGDLDKVAELSDMYAAMKLGSGKDSEALSDRLKDVKYGALFEKARLLFESEKYLEAAEEYERIVNENPNFEKIHLALYNAGIAYERIKYYDSAMRLYRRLYTEYNQTEESADALFRVGLNAEKFFEFDKAVESYMQLHDSKKPQFLRYPQRAEALKRAALILKITEQTKEAERLFERYHKEHRSMQDAPELLYEAGIAEDKLKDYDAMVKIFTEFRKYYGSDSKYRALVLDSWNRQGDDRMRRKDKRRAAKFYENAVQQYRSSSVGSKDVRYQGAKAQYMLAEIAFEQWAEKGLEGRLKVFQHRMKERIDGMRSLVEQYKVVWAYNSPEWTMASKYSIGKMFHRMADDLEQAKCPEGVHGDTCDGVLGALFEVALSMKEQAMNQYKEVIDFSRSQDLYNEWSRKSLRGMSYLIPQEYSFEQMSEWNRTYSPLPWYNPSELFEGGDEVSESGVNEENVSEEVKVKAQSEEGK